MTSVNQDVSMRSGDTKKIDIVVDELDSAGVVTGQVNLSGATIKWKAFDTSGMEQISKTTASGITILDAVGGKLQVLLDPADTAALEGRFLHETEVTDASGNVSTVTTGVLKVAKDFVV